MSDQESRKRRQKHVCHSFFSPQKLPRSPRLAVLSLSRFSSYPSLSQRIETTVKVQTLKPDNTANTSPSFDRLMLLGTQAFGFYLLAFSSSAMGNVSHLDLLVAVFSPLFRSPSVPTLLDRQLPKCGKSAAFSMLSDF